MLPFDFFSEPSLWHNTHPLSNHQHNTQTVNSTNNYENSPSLIRSFARAMTPPVSPAPDQQPPAPGQQQPKKISGFLGFYLNNKQLTKPETSSTQSQNDRSVLKDNYMIYRYERWLCLDYDLTPRADRPRAE